VNPADQGQGEGAAPAAPDLEDDGPIELPPGASCGTCAYAHTVKVPVPSKIVGQQSTRDMRICRRFPPVPVAIHTAQGVTMTAQPPVVADTEFCYEYDPAVPNLALGFGN